MSFQKRSIGSSVFLFCDDEFSSGTSHLQVVKSSSSYRNKKKNLHQDKKKTPQWKIKYETEATDFRQIFSFQFLLRMRDQKDFLMNLELRLIVTVDTEKSKREGSQLDYAEFVFSFCWIKLNAQRRMSFMNSECFYLSQACFA